MTTALNRFIYSILSRAGAARPLPSKSRYGLPQGVYWWTPAQMNSEPPSQRPPPEVPPIDDASLLPWQVSSVVSGLVVGQKSFWGPQLATAMPTPTSNAQ